MAIDEALRDALHTCVASFMGAVQVHDIRRLSGGASQETWAFTAAPTDGAAPVELIMRRAPGGSSASGSLGSVDAATEAELLRRAHTAGVQVPQVHHVLTPTDDLGEGYIMDLVAGETIPRKILREGAYADVLGSLASQCGEALAKIHAIDLTDLGGTGLTVDGSGPVPVQGPAHQLAEYQRLYERYDSPRPVFELAFRWLAEHLPAEVPPRVVHGDFRNGNLLIDPSGIAGVLDWELAHLGDPAEDLGWLCVPSWRFGELLRPVGGFGQRDELHDAYEAAGGAPVDRAAARFWEVLGTLKWGIICMTMYSIYATGIDRSVERAAIGRRSTETEIDLLALLFPERSAGAVA